MYRRDRWPRRDARMDYPAGEPADSVRFGLLGPLLVTGGAGQVAVLPSARQRTILAALLVSANTTISVDKLTEILWAGGQPPNAAAAIRNYVMRLRRQAGPAGHRIVSRPGGYAVEVRDPAELDVAEADLLRREARTEAQAGRWAQTSALLVTALALWRGEPLADVHAPALVHREGSRLAELRLQLTEARIDADMQLGRHDDLVTELRQLAAEHPLREHLQAKLMLALYRCGRQAEALAAYRETRAVLVAELGVEPGPELRELLQRMLAGDARLAQAWPPRRPGLVLGTSPGWPIPRQLPGGVRCFTGRDQELARLDALSGETAVTAVISAIGGTAGVGKTALAVHWAHRAAARFPDGQIYVNLRGYDPGPPLAAAEALAGFLRDLGTPGPDIPAEESERAARYRSLLAGRRMLIVLDNAASAGQVRPLLPGSPGCMTVVTSRDALAGLVARNDAVRVDLGLLPQREALRLLRALVGARAAAEPEAANALAARCAGLPLALRIAAELAAARPAARLAGLADELADRQRLDLLDAGGDPHTGIRAVFSWSYQHLDPAAARLFRRLGLHPGVEFDHYAAATLAATTPDEARRTLEVLARAHLAAAVRPGRYAMHDLLRAYAREVAASRDGEAECRAALGRLFDHYLHTAAVAMDVVFPAERDRRPRISEPTTPAPPLAGAAQARQWLDAELVNLVASAVRADDGGRPCHVIRLSATLSRYLAGGGHLAEAAAIHAHALTAARNVGDRAAEAMALSCLSQIDLHYGNGERAAGQLRQALALFSELRDQAGEARILHNLATVETQKGQYRQAGQHHQRALELYRDTGNRIGAARALCGLGDVDLRLGCYRQAGDHLRQALALSQEAGDQVNESYVTALLGDLSLRLHHHAEAEGRLERVLALFRVAEDRTGEAWTLAHLGAVQLAQGRGQSAVALHQEATAVARDSNDLFGEAEALNGLGEAYLATGDPAQAGTAHTRALHLARRTGDKAEQARAHVGLARSHQTAHGSTAAHGHWRAALALYDLLGTPEADQIRAQLAAGTGR